MTIQIPTEKARSGTFEEVDPLRTFVRQGRLFETLDWLNAGKPAFTAGSNRMSVLEFAARSGFISLIEGLVSIWTEQQTLDRALDEAIRYRNTDAATILIHAGASLERIDFYRVARCYNPEFLRLCMDSVDMAEEDRFAVVIRTKARSLIGACREYRSKISNGDAQMAKALVEFVKAKNLKWVSLCLWMGGDPRLAVGLIGYDDDRYLTTALRRACFDGDLAIVKALKPNPRRDDLSALLNRIF